MRKSIIPGAPSVPPGMSSPGAMDKSLITKAGATNIGGGPGASKGPGVPKSLATGAKVLGGGIGSTKSLGGFSAGDIRKRVHHKPDMRKR